MENLEITFTKPEDLERVHELLKASWLTTYPKEEFGVSKEVIEARFAPNPEELNRRKHELVPGPGYWVAKLDGYIVGFVRAVKNPSGEGQIKAIYLDPQYVGKGIGAKLMLTALEWLSDCDKAIVECASYNVRAIGFYKDFGFTDMLEIEPFVINPTAKIPQVRLTKTK